MRTLGLWSAILLVGCGGFDQDFDGYPCKGDECEEGFVCHPETETCVPVIEIGCAGVGICPSQTNTGDECPAVGSFLPCTDNAVACENGCRTCQEDSTWGECGDPVLDCPDGFVNADGRGENGCECEFLSDQETCNGVDDDCDGTVDNDAANCTTYYADADEDGAGSDSDSACLCAATVDYPVATSSDCDDNDDASYPGATEVCDGNDNDCTDGVPADEIDTDSDGYVACAPWNDAQGDQPTISGGADCDPNDGTAYAFSRMQALEVAAGADEVAAGYSVSLVFDHAALVTGGMTNADGNDIRISWDNGSSVTEIDRVLDPDSSWNSADTRVWFAVQETIAASASDTGYALRSGSAGGSAPLANEAEVFSFADFFDRADSTDVGGGWVVDEGGSGDLGIVSQELHFTATDDLENRPLADHDFTALTGAASWRFGLDWQRTGSENWYRVHMQLGAAANMDNPPGADWSNAGVGPSLLWAGTGDGMLQHEILGYEIAGTVGDAIQVSGPASVEVRLDVVAQTYDLWVDGAEATTGIEFSTSQTSLDRVRFMTSGLNDTYFARRSFPWVLVRPVLADEPTVTESGAPTQGCGT